MKLSGRELFFTTFLIFYGTFLISFHQKGPKAQERGPLSSLSPSLIKTVESMGSMGETVEQSVTVHVPLSECPIVENYFAPPREPFKTKPMIADYQLIDRQKKVKYLNEEERKACTLSVKDGLIYDGEGKLFDGSGIYVMDAEGNFYSCAPKYAETWYLHHSSFMRGQPVAAAGEMVIEKGRLTFINRVSGHYQPSPEYLRQALVRLVELRTDLELLDREMLPSF